VKNKLLSREEFVAQAHARDNNSCVICKAAASDVHHIIERKLWTDGGYYLNNAATICSTHHYEAEQTLLSCDTIREKANITEIILPEHFDTDAKYDKWGNVILPNGTRLKGEMFYTEQVQKILASANLLNLFTKYVKYPRTYHLPNSHASADDKRLGDYSIFNNKNVVVTIKMDGENTTMYNDYIHARSINSGDHPSRDRIKGDIWARISYMLDDDMRLCGENMFAKHTVEYENLESYFLLFSVWLRDTCLSWQETIEYATILDLNLVPVIYEGPFDLSEIEKRFQQYMTIHPTEGYVVRNADSFKYQDFKNNVAKYVRPEFLHNLQPQTGHWQTKKVVPNRLKSK
jgi:hypothetical protein